MLLSITQLKSATAFLALNSAARNGVAVCVKYYSISKFWIVPTGCLVDLHVDFSGVANVFANSTTLKQKAIFSLVLCLFAWA